MASFCCERTEQLSGASGRFLAPPVSWTLMGGAGRTVRSADKRRKRAGTLEQVLRLRQGVFRGPEQGPGDGGVGARGQRQEVAERHQQEQADQGGEQSLRQRID